MCLKIYDVAAVGNSADTQVYLGNMNKPVIIYTTPTCGYCKGAKEFMRAHNVDFTEIDVSSNQAKAKEMIEKSGQMGVPVIAVGEGTAQELIIGFDQMRLTKALGL